MKHLHQTTKKSMHTTFLLSSFFFLSFAPVYAAVVQVETPFDSLHVGDVFTVQVLVDTEGQTLNAFETILEYPDDVLEFVSSNSSNSVVTLWVKNPTVHEDGTVELGGITPGGVAQEDAFVLELTFKAVKEGQGIIGTRDTQLLLHDGLGTPASVSVQNLHVSVVPGESHVNVQTVDDEEPEVFTPRIERDADVYNGDYFLLFTTTDKGSGIDHFEVKEGLFGWYTEAQSPYLLRHQALDKTISVKAIDAKGNERIAILYPQHKQVWYQNKNVIAGILISCVLILLLFFLSYKKRRPS